MSRLGKRLALLMAGFLIIWLPCCAPERANEPVRQEVIGLLYRIRHEDTTMYLLGSIHIGSKAMHPFGTAIRQGMEEADIFVFECDTTSLEAAVATRSAMALPEGGKLHDFISMECYTLLEEVCRLKGYSIGRMNTLRPWAAMTTLAMDVTASEIGAESAGEAIALGVERNVRAFAREQGKRIVYLETVREQLDALDHLSLPLQEYLLREQLRIIKDPSLAKGLDADISLWPVFWQAGDEKAFAESYQRGYQDIADEDERAWADEYHTALIADRNLMMADRLDAMMRHEEPHTYFVTIGLLHVALPEDSIIRHLESRGYQVERCGQP